MSFPRKLLNEDESLVLDLRPHWWFLAGAVAALVAAVALGVVVLATDTHPVVQIATGLLVLVALVFFGVRYAGWVTTNFVLTTDRLIYRHGVLTKTGIEIPLERINTVFFNQTLFERMLGAGDLAIESAGERGRQEFSDIRKPSIVQNEIYRQMEDNENRKFDRVARGGGGPSVSDELEKLDGLRQRGVLSEEEFLAQKARLLAAGD
ncbi:PH domain-containing protein [soil metagenome]